MILVNFKSENKPALFSKSHLICAQSRFYIFTMNNFVTEYKYNLKTSFRLKLVALIMLSFFYFKLTL